LLNGIVFILFDLGQLGNAQGGWDVSVSVKESARRNSKLVI